MLSNSGTGRRRRHRLRQTDGWSGEVSSKLAIPRCLQAPEIVSGRVAGVLVDDRADCIQNTWPCLLATVQARPLAAPLTTQRSAGTIVIHGCVRCLHGLTSPHNGAWLAVLRTLTYYAAVRAVRIRRLCRCRRGRYMPAPAEGRPEGWPAFPAESVPPDRDTTVSGWGLSCWSWPLGGC